MAADCGIPISKKLGLERESRLMLEFFHNRGKLMYVTFCVRPLLFNPVVLVILAHVSHGCRSARFRHSAAIGFYCSTCHSGLLLSCCLRYMLHTSLPCLLMQVICEHDLHVSSLQRDARKMVLEWKLLLENGILSR